MSDSTLASTVNANNLPQDAVALMVWTRHTGPQPVTIIVSRDSFEKNRERVKQSGTFMAENVYQFESPVNPSGRKTVYQLSGVVGWVGNLYTGIVPVTH